MEYIYAVFVLLYGMVFGSFFNVVGMRTAKGQSVIRPRSSCPACRTPLTWKELVPLFSYLFLRGRCRTCGVKISFLYPATELLTGLLFSLSYLQFGFSWEWLQALVFLSLLMIVTVSDLDSMIIPNRVLLVFSLLFLVIRLADPLVPWWDSLAGALLGFSVLYLLAAVTRGGMGGGDIKLFFVLGLFLGTKKVLLTLFFASFLGTLFGLLLIALKKFRRKKPVPFAPFIGAGAWIAYLYGDRLLAWYLSTFLQ